uniref:Voltage-dependent calcium channel gamma-5 subunit n=1 Tax=Schizaphis graminum TaxID=13262 RepID=A0A2S2P9X4_SCHGA
MCAVSRAPENVSRTSVAFGVASLAILLTGFVTGSWVTTREPYRVPGTDGAYTAAAFRIGLWKICPTLRKTNSTMNFRSLSCKYIRYTSDWDKDLAKEDIGVDSDVYFTQSFVAKMRWCTPLVSISLCLMLAGCVFSFSGHFYKDQKTLIASSLHTLAGLILAAGLFVFASVLNDSFSPVVYQSMDDDDGDGFDGELRSEYDYRYGWSFVACSVAFLASEASAVFTITAYFRRLEDRVQYTAVNRKPSLDTPPPTCVGDRTSSACSADGRADSPDSDAGAAGATTTETTSRSDQSSSSSAAVASGRHQPAQCLSGGAGGGDQAASSSPSPGGGAAESCSNSAATSKTPPDICPPKIGCDGSTSTGSGGAATGCRLPAAAATYCSATLNHPHKSQHQHHVNHQQQHHHHQQHTQHYRQTLAVGGNGSCYEVDTSKPCTCTSAATLTTKRYATIAGVARHNGGKQYTTTTTTTALTNNHNNNNNGRRSAAGLAAIKESVASLADHHSLQHNSSHHHRKPDPPTRRLKASVGGYVVPQTPIAALEALDCPPAADPRLVVPSSV